MSIDREKDPFLAHVRHVEVLENAGVTPPPSWSIVRQQVTDMLAIATPMGDRLIAAVCDPDSGADLPALYAAALAEQGTANMRSNPSTASFLPVLTTPCASCTAPSRSRTTNSSPPNSTRQHRNSTRSSTSSTPNSPPNTSSTKTPHAGRLEAGTAGGPQARPTPASPQSAAALCGIAATHRPEVTIGLTVDANSASHQAVWSTWEGRGRCGRWSFLLATGAIIRACPIDEVQPFRRAAADDLQVSTIA